MPRLGPSLGLAPPARNHAASAAPTTPGTAALCLVLTSSQRQLRRKIHMVKLPLPPTAATLESTFASRHSPALLVVCSSLNTAPAPAQRFRQVQVRKILTTTQGHHGPTASAEGVGMGCRELVGVKRVNKSGYTRVQESNSFLQLIISIP
jgi:hypothetical protein